MRIFYFIFLLISSPAFSQLGSIHGSIIDKETNIPIHGATVNVGGSNSDNTDTYGSFRILNILPGEYELIASHVGYKTEIISVEVKENAISSINVTMKVSEPSLEEVRLNSRRSTGINTIGQVDIMLRPVNTSQDILRFVPGIFIAQHAGGGKAEQIFLRGFDIDHGTDIKLSADGMPVNMVSHAHGQGYADLHFLIPETIEKISFELGPYSTAKGNLATAGHVDFKTKDFLRENLLKLEVGQFNTQRLTSLLKIFSRNTADRKQQLYVAGEYFRNDNYFESPQNFHRVNLFAKYNSWFGNQSQLSISASAFDSKWDASGQIPERAVRNRLITRFGSIDDTEGGNTSRYNINGIYTKQGKGNWKYSHQLFASRYDFRLFSNFTFFLEDPVNGDQIRQSETRYILGYNGTASKAWMLGNKKVMSEIGASLRQDLINDVELSRSLKRSFREYIRKGDVRETNSSVYTDQHIDLSNTFSMSAGLRFDHFIFGYRDENAGEANFKTQSKAVVSPKLKFTYSPNTNTRIFLHNGIGFHSNDTRVILDAEANNILPRTFGTDLGILLKPIPRLVLQATAWHLYSEQEFVYVGDAGIIEPGGKTRRLGFDLSARYQVRNWLFADFDLNLTKARAIDETKGEDFVPLAPSITSVGGITVTPIERLSGSLRYRYIADRPANETNSVTARGYTIADVMLNYRWKKFELHLSVENLFNAEWNEAQFDTESRLFNEPDPVSEIHYTPGRPRFFKAGISFYL